MKTEMSCHYTLFTMGKCQNTDNIKCWAECKATENLIADRNVKWYIQSLLKTF